MPPWMLALGNWFESGRWMPLLGLVVALPLLWAGLGGTWRQVRFLATAEQATGRVHDVQDIVEHDPDLPATNRKKRHRWVVSTECTPKDGEAFRFTTETIGGFGPGVKEGDQPQVAWLAADPAGTAQLLVGTRGLTAPVLLALAGVVVAGVSVAIALR